MKQRISRVEYVDISIPDFAREFDIDKTVGCEVHFTIVQEAGKEIYIQIDRVYFNEYNISELVPDYEWEMLQKKFLVDIGEYLDQAC